VNVGGGGSYCVVICALLVMKIYGKPERRKIVPDIHPRGVVEVRLVQCVPAIHGKSKQGRKGK